MTISALRKRSISPLHSPVAHIKAKPFLKWVGGKTQLLPEIYAHMPQEFGRYYEPFVGGGALFYNLEPRLATLSDFNHNLILTYRAIQQDLGGVIRELKKHKATEEHYYAVRAQDPTTMKMTVAAARTIFLNRTCFNGLYRVNKKGKFNVPFGRYAKPKICNEENLERVSDALQGVNLKVGSVFDTAKCARRGDFVYFDPPYDPLSATASFTGYTGAGFGRSEQIRLANLFTRLAKRGVKVMLSNSDTPFINELYQDFHIEKVYARRAINSRADRRGPVTEVLVMAGY